MSDNIFPTPYNVFNAPVRVELYKPAIEIALEFVPKNLPQIRQKSKKFCVEEDEITNDIFIFIATNFHKYDPARATFEAFVFGAIETMYTCTDDALDRAQHVSDEMLDAVNETALQNAATDAYKEPNDVEECPGAANLRAISAVVAGLTSTEIGATTMRVGKRQANNKIRRLIEVAQVQFGLNFGGESK